jgi:hypothetical protein
MATQAGGALLLLAGQSDNGTGGAVSITAGDSTASAGGSVSLLTGVPAAPGARLSLVMGTSATLTLGKVSGVSGAFTVRDSGGTAKLTVDAGTADSTTINSKLVLSKGLVGAVQFPTPNGGHATIVLGTSGSFVHIGGATSGADQTDIRLSGTSPSPEEGMILMVYNGHGAVSTLTFAGGITVNLGQLRMLTYINGGWTSPT